MASIDFNNLNFQNPGSLPLPVKMLAMVLVFALVLGVFAYFIFYADGSPWEEQENLALKEEQLKKEFAEKAQRANNIEAYEEQVKRMGEEMAAPEEVPVNIPPEMLEGSPFAERSR